VGDNGKRCTRSRLSPGGADATDFAQKNFSEIVHPTAQVASPMWVIQDLLVKSTTHVQPGSQESMRALVINDLADVRRSMIFNCEWVCPGPGFVGCRDSGAPEDRDSYYLFHISTLVHSGAIDTVWRV